MPRAVIRSNRAEVSGRFPLLGFTVRTGPNPFFEVAMATDPTLFADKTRRTPNNFYSTRALGPLPAEGDEAIYLVPDDVLRRFVGQERIYYAVATFSDRSRTKADAATLPTDAIPFVNISRSFTGRVLRQTVGTGTRAGGGGDNYGSEHGASLEWAGDSARAVTDPAPSPQGTEPAAPNGKSAASPTAQAKALELDAPYDDGYSRELWNEAGTRGGYRAMSVSGSTFDIGWADVDVVPQLPNLSCWAAAAAMIVGWRDEIATDPLEIARGAGAWAKYVAGLTVTDVGQFADAWNLDAETPRSYSVDALRQLVETRGPLWIAAHAPGPHAIVVTGIYGDGTPDATYVRINDPWGRATGAGAPGAYNQTPGQGSQYVLTYRQFAAEYGSAAPLPDADVLILHVKERDMAARSPLVTSQAYALWQSVDARRPASRAFDGPTSTPIPTAIPGAVMTRVAASEGDVTWQLDQLQGLKHPDNNPANAGSGAFSTTTTAVTGWPSVENYLKDSISADFEMRWQYNGASLGNIEISNTATNDAVGWGLDVTATILDDAVMHDGKAGVRVRFSYRFNRVIGSDVIAICDYTLFGDGKFTRTCRWTQDSPAAQSLGVRGNGQHGAQRAAPSRALVAPVVVPIASAIAGAVMTRIFNNEGDIKWELDQMRGMKHVGDNAANAGPLSPTWTTITVGEWPKITNGFDDAIYADFEIRWQYDGRSLGNVSIVNITTNDALAWGLGVKAQIMDDAAAYSRPGAAASFAAVNVQFYYRFDRTFGSDRIAINDFTLYGDGTYSKSSRWTQ